MTLISLPADNLLKGTNSLKIWNSGLEAGFIKRIRIYSAEEGAQLKDSIEAAYNNNSVTSYVNSDQVAQSAEALIIAKANLAEANAIAWADGEITTTEASVLLAAQAQADLAETTAKAWADGIVTLEEERAIADAQAKADAAELAAKNHTEGWSTEGADITADNTAQDVTNISGTPVGTVVTDLSTAKANADAAKTAIDDMGADGKLSIDEKSTWRRQFPTIETNYTSYAAMGIRLTVSISALSTAKDALEAYLISEGVWSRPTESDIIDSATMTARLTAYYQALEDFLIACSTKETEDWSEEGATNNTGALADKDEVDFGLEVVGDSKPKSYRVVATGNKYPTPGDAGLFTDTGTRIATVGFTYKVCVYNRTTHAWVATATYNVYSSTTIAGNMATYLNSLGEDRIVVIFTYDEPQTNRLANGLDEAMYRCGASKAIYGSVNFKYRSAYILLGIPGVGSGNGTELYSGDADEDEKAWMETEFQITNGNISLAGSFPPILDADALTGWGDVNSPTEIGGTYIKSGTVSAAKLIAGTITAASGIIGDLAITNAHIDNLSVGNTKIDDTAVSTGKIQDYAVTSTTSYYIDSEITLTTTYQTIVSSPGALPGVVSGDQVFIWFNSIQSSGLNNSPLITYKLYVGGVLLYTSSPQHGNKSFTVVVTAPSTGDLALSVQAVSASTDTNYTQYAALKNRAVLALVTRK